MTYLAREANVHENWQRIPLSNSHEHNGGISKCVCQNVTACQSLESVSMRWSVCASVSAWAVLLFMGVSSGLALLYQISPNLVRHHTKPYHRTAKGTQGVSAPLQGPTLLSLHWSELYYNLLPLTLETWGGTNSIYLRPIQRCPHYLYILYSDCEGWRIYCWAQAPYPPPSHPFNPGYWSHYQLGASLHPQFLSQAHTYLPPSLKLILSSKASFFPV